MQWKKPKLPFIFLFDFLIYSLAIFLAFHSFLLDPSCLQWQVGAGTITLAWINLLLHMRLLYWIGDYIIIFKDVVLTFLAVSVVFLIMLTGFAFSFHILLSHRQEFQSPHDAMLKTIIMMSGKNNIEEKNASKETTFIQNYDNVTQVRLNTEKFSSRISLHLGGVRIGTKIGKRFLSLLSPTPCSSPLSSQ